MDFRAWTICIGPQPPGFCEAFWHTKKHLAAIIGLSNSREHLSGVYGIQGGPWPPTKDTSLGMLLPHLHAHAIQIKTLHETFRVKHKKAYIYIYILTIRLSAASWKAQLHSWNLITVVNLEHVLAVLFPVARHLKWGTSSSPAGPGPPRKPRRSRPKWGCWMRAIHLAGMARTGFSLMISLVLFSSAPKPDTTGGYA